MISIRRFLLVGKTRNEPEQFAHAEDIYRYVFARVGQVETAEDITMEVVHNCKKTSETGNLKAYMIGVARKKVVDHYRHLSRTRKQPKAESTYNISDRDDFLSIQAVLAKLAENYQEHLILKYICGFASEEVAAMVGTTPTAVDNTLQRARKAFADEWNLLNGEQE